MRTTRACGSDAQLSGLMLLAAALNTQYSTPDSIVHETVAPPSPATTLTSGGALEDFPPPTLQPVAKSAPNTSRERARNFIMTNAFG